MSLVLNAEQLLLKQTARDFVRRESPVERLRRLRDSEDPLGFSRELWRKMAELGWPAILIPEEHGGLGMGHVAMACVLEECGRNLVPEPLVSTVLLGAGVVELAGSDEQKRAILPAVADGSLLLAVAYQERGSRYDACNVTTKAERHARAYTLSGAKTLVLDGHSADRLIVSARTSGQRTDHDGVSLFLVDKDLPGLRVVRQTAVDLRNVAIVELDGVEVDESDRLGGEGEAASALEGAIDRATAGLCAEMLGTMSAAFEMTLEYLKTRKQFGVVIGTFQALKHRAARMFIDIELARSAVLGACSALDANAADAPALVSAAKARCSDAAVSVGYEGIQMHGGIGMTDEHDVGFYAKRARAQEITFGDSAYHRDRFASLQGF